MATILEALKANNASITAQTIGKALGGDTIAQGVTDSGASTATPTAYVVSFDANTGSGTVAPMACVKGAEYTLPGGTGLTAPSGKQFKGWGTTSSATSVITKYTASAAATLYAIWEDTPSEE